MCRLLPLLLLLLAAFSLSAQNVTNVSCHQEGKKIVIKYNLDKETDIRLQLSRNGGASFSELQQGVSGHVGKKVSAGTNTIVYDPLLSNEEFVGDNFVFKVIAETGRGTINGHEYVDLGLPSGLKWATCNVGASTPEGYGNYYAWGETKPKKVYTERNSVTDGNSSIGNIAGNAQYDAARANWGGSWRLPTKEEIQELLDNCKHKWTTRNGVKGRLFTSKKNGKSIFLPAAGYRIGSSLYNAGENGYYWSATPYESASYYACGLYFYSGDAYWALGYRYYGHGIRPVSE